MKNKSSTTANILHRYNNRRYIAQYIPFNLAVNTKVSKSQIQLFECAFNLAIRLMLSLNLTLVTCFLGSFGENMVTIFTTV